MRVTASSPDMTPQSVGKVIPPDELQRGVRRNPLYQSASDEAREIPKRQLKRRISISEGELREQIGFRSIRNPVATRAKFTKNRAATTFDHLDGAKLQLKRMSQQIAGPSQLNAASRHHAHSLSSLVDPCRVQFALSQTPPMAAATSTFVPMLNNGEHRGELDMAEKYNYDLARAQLKASSRTSALLAGFAMVALVELQYDEDTPRPVLILLGVVTSLLVSVHLLALMMSTCILPYMEATGCTQDSPHIKLKFYIDLSWIFSTCIGLLLFLFEIGIIFIVKFFAVHFQVAAYVTTAMLVPVVIVFIVFSYLIHKNRVSHSFDRINMKIGQLHDQLTAEAGLGVKKPPTVQDI